MELLRQLLELANETNFAAQAPSSNKYPTQTPPAVAVSEEVNNIIDGGSDYMPMAKPSKTSKKKRQPMTDKTQHSLVNTLWFYGNSDAT
jgi:hypothetical protein